MYLHLTFLIVNSYFNGPLAYDMDMDIAFSWWFNYTWSSCQTSYSNSPLVAWSRRQSFICLCHFQQNWSCFRHNHCFISLCTSWNVSLLAWRNEAAVWLDFSRFLAKDSTACRERDDLFKPSSRQRHHVHLRCCWLEWCSTHQASVSRWWIGL